MKTLQVGKKLSQVPRLNRIRKTLEKTKKKVQSTLELEVTRLAHPKCVGQREICFLCAATCLVLPSTCDMHVIQEKYNF